MSRYHRGRGEDSALSLVVLLTSIVFMMPIVGLYFLLKKEPSKRVLG